MTRVLRAASTTSSVDGVQVVDFHDAVDLDEQSLDEPEVPAGDACDRGDGLGVGEVVGVEGESESVPVSVEDESQFVAAQGPVFVGESDTAVELWLSAELFFQAGHADQDETDLVAVLAASKDLESGLRSGVLTRRR